MGRRGGRGVSPPNCAAHAGRGRIASALRPSRGLGLVNLVALNPAPEQQVWAGTALRIPPRPVAGVRPLTNYRSCPSACFRRFDSEPFAGLLRFIAAALPPGKI